MKKLLICLLCINFITFISFASSDIEVSDSSDSGEPVRELFSQKYTEEEQATLLEEQSPLPPIENKQYSTTEQENKRTSNFLFESKTKNSENKKYDIYDYPALNDIKEPKIITIEPEITEEKEELVETELPPLEENIDKTGKSENQEQQNKLQDITIPENSVNTTEEDNTSKTDKTEVTENNIPEEKKHDTPENNIPEEKKHDTHENHNSVQDENEGQPEVTESVTEEEIEPVIDIIKPSRSVTMKRQEYVDITYPGTGWIYIGITDGSKDLSYFGRALGTKDTTFTLQAKTPGSKLLHFCKNDYLTGEYIDDYIEVVILPEEGSNKTHIEAPDYKQPEPEAFSEFENNKETPENKTEQEQSLLQETSLTEETQEKVTEKEKQETKKENINQLPIKQTEKKPVEKYDTVSIPESEYEGIDISDFDDDEIIIPEEEVMETSENSDTTDCNTLLKEANFLYNEKEFKAAYDKVNKYLEFATTNIDDGLLLKGQILEAKSELQDIKAAIQIYNTLMKDFPASSHWDEANKRVIYLKRFYLEVR